VLPTPLLPAASIYHFQQSTELPHGCNFQALAMCLPLLRSPSLPLSVPQPLQVPLPLSLYRKVSAVQEGVSCTHPVVAGSCPSRACTLPIKLTDSSACSHATHQTHRPPGSAFSERCLHGRGSESGLRQKSGTGLSLSRSVPLLRGELSCRSGGLTWRTRLCAAAPATASSRHSATAQARAIGEALPVWGRARPCLLLQHLNPCPLRACSVPAYA